MANKEKRPTVNVKKEKGTNKKTGKGKTDYQKTRDAYKNGTKSFRRSCREKAMNIPRHVDKD